MKFPVVSRFDGSALAHNTDILQMWIHPKSIHYIFTIKGYTMPIAAFALFDWCMANGGRLGAIDLAR